MREKINFGIVGTGKISNWFLEAAFKVDEFNFKGLYSRTEESGKAFLKNYEGVKLYTSLEDMINDEEIHAIYIASPNSKHFEQAVKCLNGKKPVLCEKAFASNKKEAFKMIECAKTNDTLLMEAMRITVLPNFLEVKNHIHKIGKIRKYIASYCQYSSRYDNFKNGIIENAFKSELSNGALMDIGVYCIHPMVALFGAPKSLKASGTLLHTGVDGQGSIIFDYEDMEGVVNFSKISNSYLPSEIQGEEGSIIINKINSFTEVKIVYRDGREEIISKEQEIDDIYYEVKEFIELYKNGEKTSRKNKLETSLEVMKLIDEAKLQMNYGKKA